MEHGIVIKNVIFKTRSTDFVHVSTECIMNDPNQYAKS